MTSSDVLDTALGVQLARGGRASLVARRARVPRRLGRAGAGARGHGLRRAHPRHPRRADDVRHQAGRLRLRGRPQRASAWSAAVAQAASARSPARSGPTPRPRPDFERRVLARLGMAARAGLHAGRRPRPPRRAAAGDRAGRRGRWSASPPSSATCSAPRCARSRSRFAPARRRARARCPTSATRSRPSASPAWRACCAATRRPRWRTWRSGTSATSRTPVPSASILPDATIALDYMQALATRARARHGRPPRPHAREHRPAYGALFSQRVLLGAGGRRAAARRRLPIVQRNASRRGTTGPAAPLLAASSSSASTDVFDLGHYTEPRRRSSSNARRRSGLVHAARSCTVMEPCVTAAADSPAPVASGKVREIHARATAAGMVASDRISTYDVVHPNGIPDKGSVLTGISAFWFNRTGHIVPNHCISGRPRAFRTPDPAARWPCRS